MRPTKITAQTIHLIEQSLKASLIAKKEYECVIRLHDGSLKARQRALCKIWLKDIAEAQGIPVEQADAFCKYQFGLKIRCEDDPLLESIIRKMLDGREYEQKLQIIANYSEWFPILRDRNGMTSEQIGRYLREIQQSFAEQGIILSSNRDDEMLLYPEARR